MIKRVISVTIIATLLLSACGGRAAHPINAFGLDDGTMSCLDIKSEMVQNKREIADRYVEKARIIRRNIGDLFMFWLFLIPVFLLDLNNTQNIEIDAFKARNKRLEDMTILKQCPAYVGNSGGSL